MKLFLLLVLYLLTRVSKLSEAQSCGSRVRKDWEMMTETEKTTYRNAIRAAMDSGAYIKFVELHTEMTSEKEAHGQCMFTYWHRYMLLAFENMLRGQGAAYACVTVPYFN
ncbi:Common central domain of tyrosinase [Phytophthora infestans]|uniref:Common central domain of tyrosinase n=1 Tax=Phytophthora infestans TaxID=4787 RepID=A0A833TPT6_PHYIN|nr:Common central domain of tyrosinase [Phytophthora infestans]